MKKLYLEEVDSTNKWGKEHISDLEHLSVVYTYKQSAGRGRLERKWNYTGEGNIYASIVIKPEGEMLDVYANLTQYLSLILAKVMEEYHLKHSPKIKWPNDVRINGKKISGILAEGVNDGERFCGLVLGFGVNLNCEKSVIEKIEQPATSLNLETGMEIDKEIFLNRVLDEFCLGYDSFIKKGFSLIKDEYKKRAEFLDTNIAVKVFDKTIEGFVKDVTDNGALKIIDNCNEEQVLYIGDIL